MDPQTIHAGFGSFRPQFVRWFAVGAADIDQQGRASNVAVVAWMNDTAVAHSASLGYDAAAYRRLGGMFVVRRLEIDYLRAALAGDALACGTRVTQMERASAERRYEIVRPADGALIARGQTSWAFVDAASGRPARVPAELIAAFVNADETAA